MGEWVIRSNNGGIVGSPGTKAEIDAVISEVSQYYGEGVFRACRKPKLKLVIDNRVKS